MTMKRLARLPLALAILGSALWPAASASAQGTPNPNEAAFVKPEVVKESGGDPLYGYLAAGFFAGLAIFTVCKTSRRG